MTRLQSLDLPSINRSTIGFDRLFDELNRQFANSASTGYPPYNVIQVNEDEYLISLAVAGFRMEDLRVTQENNTLTIKGEQASEAEEDVKYLHRGIAARRFTRDFTLADHVEVVDAALDLGMLNVRLKREIPEKYRPRQIAIQSSVTEAIGKDAE